MVTSTSTDCTASTSASAVTSDPTGRESDVDSDEEEQARTKVVSLLDRLRSPTAADIARARKIKTNSEPPRGKRRCRGALSSDPKGVTPSQRVREFENEALTVSHGQLYSGVTPLVAYPYFLMWLLWSAPVSSTKINTSGSKIRVNTGL